MQMIIIPTFLDQLRNKSIYRFIPTRPFLRYIIVCFLILKINNKIHAETLGVRISPKKWISEFQALRVGDLLLNHSNLPTKFCNRLQTPIPTSSSYLILPRVKDQNMGVGYYRMKIELTNCYLTC